MAGAVDPSADDSLSEAYGRHSDELLSFLRRNVRCPHQAADLRQEVYLRFRQVPRLERIGDVRAYLYRIARNLIIDQRRQRKVERALFDSSTDAREQELSSTVSAPATEAVAAGLSDVAQLQAALAELPAAHRNALLWYRLHGLTLRQIGDRLGVSESMAGRYVNKALEHCQDRLGRPG